MVRLWAAGLIMTAAAISAKAGPPSSVTFTKDVLPILQEKCQMCHRTGQVAPMSLLSYQEARPYAAAIKAAVVARKMPPWSADPNYGHFLNNRSLSQSQIETLVAWADSGAAEGSAADAPPPKQWPSGGWQVQPDIVLDSPDFDVPASGVIDWMWVPIAGGMFTKDTWITSIQWQPLDYAVVHHIGIAFVPHKPDVKYGEPVWERVLRDANQITIPGQRSSANSVVRDAIGGGFQDTYVPGHAISDYRSYDAARFIPANTDVYLNLHYTPNGKPLRTHVRVGFTVAKEPPKRQVVMVDVGGPTDREHFRIPAGDADYTPPPGEATFTRDVEIFSLMPHMHLRGKAMDFVLTYPDGRTEKLLNVPHYDFNWQLEYDTDIKVPKGSKLKVTAQYDNSTGNRFNPDANHDVYYGEQTWEEMESGYVFVLVDDPNFDPRHPDLVEKNSRTQAAAEATR